MKEKRNIKEEDEKEKLKNMSVDEMKEKIIEQEKTIKKNRKEILKLHNKINEVNELLEIKEGEIQSVKSMLINQDKKYKNDFEILNNKINDIVKEKNNKIEELKATLSLQENKFTNEINNIKLFMDYLGEIIQNNGQNNFGLNNGQNIYPSDISLPKINICFKNFNGKQKIITYNYGTPLNQALKNNLPQIGIFQVSNNPKKINFTYDAKKLSLDDETPIEIVFSPNTSVTVQTSF